MRKSEYKVKMQYVVNTPKTITIVVTVVCKDEPSKAMREVNNFVKLLDKEIREFLERRRMRNEPKEEYS